MESRLSEIRREMETGQEAIAMMQVGDAGGQDRVVAGEVVRKGRFWKYFESQASGNFWKDYKDCLVVVRGVVGSGIGR